MASTILIGRDSGGLLMLNRQTLDSLFKQSHIANMEVAVVGVIGAPKSGKSFLLNYIMRYFRNEGKVLLNWMKGKDPQTIGFPWNSPTETSEQVCIWSEPIIVEREIDQKEIAVFLIEFGGAENVLPQYQALALRTCSLLIFNEVQTISNSTLSNLLSIYATFLDNKELSFPHIAFLVRDASTEYRKSGKNEAKAYLLETFQKLSPARPKVDISDIIKEWIFAFLPVPAFNSSDQASSFRGEFSALGKSFHQPFGEFISEVLDTELICFNPTSVMMLDGEMYANHFRNQHNRGHYQNLNLRQFRGFIESAQPMDIATCTTDVNCVHEKGINAFEYSHPLDENEAMGAAVTPARLYKPLTMSIVSQHEMDITSASSSSETSFNTPTQTFSEANFKRSLDSSELTPKNLPEEPLVSHISVLALRIANNSSRGSNFPNSISSVVGTKTSVDVSHDSEKATRRSNPEVSYSANAEPEFEITNKSRDAVAAYKAASGIHGSSGLYSREHEIEQHQIRGNKNGRFTNNSTKSESKSDSKSLIRTMASSSVPKENLGNEAAEDMDVDSVRKNYFITFKNKFQETLDHEMDLEKLKEKHSELELKCISDFKAIGSLRGQNILKIKIEEAAKEITFDIDEHWSYIVKHHEEDCSRVTRLMADYERVFIASVKAALQSYFDKTQGPNMDSIINQSKTKASATVSGHDFGKFRATFSKQINTVIENVNKSAKSVETLVSNFHNEMGKKINMFNSLSDEELQKHQAEFKSQDIREFDNCNDLEFHSILERLHTNISQHLETQTREIRRCQEKCTDYIVVQLKEFYNVEMQQFCHKKVHTSRAINEFHFKLINATVEYFFTVCKFTTDYGIDIGKYTSSLETCCNKTLERFLTTNSIQAMKASQNVAKANSRARAEYNKIMTEKLGNKSVPENQLNQYHEKTLTEVLVLFNLNIQQMGGNCDQEINSFRDNISRTSRKEWQEVNKERRQWDVKKVAAEKLLMETELAAQDETRIQAEAKKRIQLEASAILESSKQKMENEQIRATLNGGFTKNSPTTSEAVSKTVHVKANQQKNVPSITLKTSDAVSKAKLDNDDAKIVDVEDLMKKSFKTFKQEVKMFLDKEIDLNKLKEKHSELELKYISSFKALGSAKEKKVKSEIEEAAKQLTLDIKEHWNAIVNQHDEDCSKVKQLVVNYERVYMESVKAALRSYFDKTQRPNMNSIIIQSKSKAAETVSGHEFGKFRSIYTKRITDLMENVNNSAKLVENLVSNFHSQMEKKISMYTCLSDKEFQKNQTEFNSQAMRAFGDCKDPDFRSILESQLRNISQHLETRNREICRCEEKVADYAVAQLKEFYNVEMQQFCHKKVHTSHAIREFHIKLINATVEYFTTVCKFNTVSGIDNWKYTSSLETCCNKLLEGFLTTNSIQVMKASQTVAKANSKAKAEYNKLMGEKLGDKSVPQNQLNQYHEKTLTEVLLIFKLNIQQIAENCDEGINSLRDNINRTSRKEWQEENEERRQREAKKAEVEKLIMEIQMAAREEEARIQAEAKKCRKLGN